MKLSFIIATAVGRLASFLVFVVVLWHCNVCSVVVVSSGIIDCPGSIDGSIDLALIVLLQLGWELRSDLNFWRDEQMRNIVRLFSVVLTVSASSK